MNKVIEIGCLKNRNSEKHVSYEMRVLDTSDIEELLTLQQEVLSALRNPELCVYLSEFEVREMLGNFGEMVGIFVENSMVAFAGTLYPGMREDNLGRDFGFSEEELMKVAHLEFALVHPTYRGYSLQKLMAKYLIEEVIRNDRWSYVLNTISPYNPSSLDTDFYLGFAIIRVSSKYGGALRYTLLNNIKNPIKVDKNSLKVVPLSDIERQRELIEQGYYGISFAKGDKRDLVYGKVVQG